MLHSHGENIVTESVSLAKLTLEIADDADVEDKESLKKISRKQPLSAQVQLDELMLTCTLLDNHGMLLEKAMMILVNFQSTSNF